MLFLLSLLPPPRLDLRRAGSVFDFLYLFPFKDWLAGIFLVFPPPHTLMGPVCLFLPSLHGKMAEFPQFFLPGASVPDFLTAPSTVPHHFDHSFFLRPHPNVPDF